MDEKQKEYENDNVYCILYQWMITKLGLSGVELILYAVIYGYTQSDAKKFSGSIAYLQYRTGASKQQVITKLKLLVEKGYIERKEIYKDGVKYVDYWSKNLTGVVKKLDRGGKETVPGVVKKLDRGSQEILPHIKEQSKDTKESSNTSTNSDTPDLQEILEYIWQKQSYVDPEKFHDYYESRGWKRKNGKPIDDWRKLVVEWDEREKRMQQAKPSPASTAGVGNAKPPKNAPTGESSFDVDDFFAAALRRSYEDLDGG